MKKPTKRRKPMAHQGTKLTEKAHAQLLGGFDPVADRYSGRAKQKTYLGVPIVGSADAAPPQPTVLADLQSALNHRIMRLDVQLESLEALVHRLVGPKPQPPQGNSSGVETNPGGYASALHDQARVIDHQLDRLQEVLETLNKVV